MLAVTIADALFTKTQQRVLGLLFGKPDTRYYTNEIVRKVNMGRGTVSRELEKLTASGILQMSRSGNQLYYQANSNSPVFNELIGIIRKTSGIADVLKQALVPVDDKIDFSFVYGSIAKGSEDKGSDIDLMLVGFDLSYSDVMELLIPVEDSLQREINPTIFTPQEFEIRLEEEQSFVRRIMNQPKLMIKGEIDDTGKSIPDKSA